MNTKVKFHFSNCDVELGISRIALISTSFAILVNFIACGTGKRTLGIDEPAQIGTTPQTLAFNDVTVGETVSQYLHITNYGDVELEVDSIYLEDSEEFFIEHLELPVNIKNGIQFLVIVYYMPNDEGNDETLLIIESNDNERSILGVELSGIAIVP